MGALGALGGGGGRARRKDEGVALILAIVLGLFGISGIGHFYIGKISRGAAFLVGTIILYWAGVSLLWVGVPTVMIGVGIGLMGFGVILLVAALVLFVWSVFNVRSLCKSYNAHVDEHGKPPPDW